MIASKANVQCMAGLHEKSCCPPLQRSPASSSSRHVFGRLSSAGSYPHRQRGRMHPISSPGRQVSSICVRANELRGDITARPSMKFGIVVARFNSLVTKQLLEGALEDFERHGVDPDNIDVAWVPGSFELPVVASSMARSGQYQAIVCIGAVIQGATTHYDAVVGAATNGVLNAGLQTGVPVVFGVLTTDTLEQALDRAGGKVGNKGGEAALTAIEMATLMRELELSGKAVKAKQ